MKEKVLTFYDSDGIINTYNLTDPDLTYFLFNTTFEEDSFLDEYLLKFFHKDVGYDLNYGDRKSERFYMIKMLENKKDLKKNKTWCFEI